MKLRNPVFTILIIVTVCINCKPDVKNTNPNIVDNQPKTLIVKPNFSSDSAFEKIQTQVNFGPRVPGTKAHKACSEWIIEQLKTYGANTVVQQSQVKRYDGTIMPMYNIVGSYNPTAKKRLLLCAHWDTRHLADQDTEDKEKPIDGANDGGSGVGILLEVARQLQLKSPTTGVDILFFDVEDQGQPDNLPYIADTYCLGSQYWAKTPHVPGYQAQAGILLDMCGAKDAVFTLEGTSMRYAPDWMRSVWDIAIQLKHSKYFHYEKTAPITDDHLFINKIAGIPTIDIIHYDNTTRSGFGTYWHTHDDTMDVIDKETLQAVGETLLAVIQNF